MSQDASEELSVASIQIMKIAGPIIFSLEM